MIKWIKGMECTQDNWARLMMMRCTQSKLGRVMLWCGKQLYNYIVIHQPKDRVTAIHFAESERAMNESTREYVEGLDESYKK